MSHELIVEETFPSDEDFDEDEDSESSTDVDAKVAEEEVFDDEFFKCYSALKKRDSKIYDKTVRFFNADEDTSEDDAGDRDDQSNDRLLGDGKRISAPKMTLLDHQLNLKDEELEEPKIDLNMPVSKSFYEKELEEIKKSIEKVNADIDSDSDEDLLIVKGSDDKESRPRKKINLLLDELESKEDEDIKRLKEIWSDSSKLSKEDKFLRDYILNKRYIASNNEDEEPTGSGSGKSAFFSENIDDLSDVEDGEGGCEQKESTKFHLHSEDKDFDKIKRIPRNSTKTIRDLKEKQEKKEKRQKKLESEKKKRKALRNADCEDIVGDLPTRFHYRETEPNDYGLSAEELLMATDEELEKWVKLNETIGYKTREEEIAQKLNYEKKRNDLELKKRIFKSIYGDEDGDQTEVAAEANLLSKKSGKKRKRNNVSEIATDDKSDNDGAPDEVSGDKVEESNRKKKKRKHKRGLNHKKFAKVGVAPDRLLAYGLSKTKLKKSKLL